VEIGAEGGNTGRWSDSTRTRIIDLLKSIVANSFKFAIVDGTVPNRIFDAFGRKLQQEIDLSYTFNM
jgi:hypothetical protein